MSRVVPQAVYIGQGKIIEPSQGKVLEGQNKARLFVQQAALIRSWTGVLKER